MIKKRKDLIPISNIIFQGNEVDYVRDAVESNWVSSIGSYIDKFEIDFAATMDCSFAVSVNNGTSALLLALKALDIGPGDEVIVPSLTFAATVNAIIYAGATPVLVDSLEDHWNLDPVKVENAVTSSTKAIIPVHLYGHPCDMASILLIATKYDLFVVEDAAEAHNAVSLSKKVGSLGTIGCFSFYGNKILTTGEGGMCVTQDAALNDRLRTLRDHGMNKNRRYWHDEVGFNFRMTNLNAALGVAQLEQLSGFLQRRKHLSNLYDQGFTSLSESVYTKTSPFGDPVHWLYCLFVKESCHIKRDDLITKLKEYNIDVRPVFHPAHAMPPYKKLRRSVSMQNSEIFGSYGLNLPINPTLTNEDVQYIIEAIGEILK